MYPFLETIRIDHGIVRNLVYHQKRMDQAIWDFHHQQNPVDLDKLIICSAHLYREKVKCRVLYDLNAVQIEYLPYVKNDPRSFRLVEANDLSYGYKFADRTRINQLLTKNMDYDEIIIVQNGMITDTSYTNLVFRKNRWLFTPEHALLKGTKRQRYLDEGRVKIKPISIKDLSGYAAFKCINAMLDLEDTDWIPVDHIMS